MTIHEGSIVVMWKLVLILLVDTSKRKRNCTFNRKIRFNCECLLLITRAFQKLKPLRSGRFIYLTPPLDGRRSRFDHIDTQTYMVMTTTDDKQWHRNFAFPNVRTRDLALSVIPC